MRDYRKSRLYKQLTIDTKIQEVRSEIENKYFNTLTDILTYLIADANSYLSVVIDDDQFINEMADSVSDIFCSHLNSGYEKSRLRIHSKISMVISERIRRNQCGMDFSAVSLTVKFCPERKAKEIMKYIKNTAPKLLPKEITPNHQTSLCEAHILANEAFLSEADIHYILDKIPKWYVGFSGSNNSLDLYANGLIDKVLMDMSHYITYGVVTKDMREKITPKIMSLLRNYKTKKMVFWDDERQDYYSEVKPSTLFEEVDKHLMKHNKRRNKNSIFKIISKNLQWTK